MPTLPRAPPPPTSSSAARPPSPSFVQVLVEQGHRIVPSSEATSQWGLRLDLLSTHRDAATAATRSFMHLLDDSKWRMDIVHVEETDGTRISVLSGGAADKGGGQ